MKKLLALCAAMLLLVGSAAATSEGTVTNDAYPGGIRAQAQLLKELGLFQGTEAGFELEKPMTRAEAAAMLVRYLGKEDAARAGDWKHPFTDVPAWAEHGIGWLYENGLTRGVSATQFGAEEPVTCAQFCIFLSRAASGTDTAVGRIASPEEIAACDRAGFVRADAVSLAARTLSVPYTQDSREIPMAQFFIEQGVFTPGQLGSAARYVLPCQYTDASGGGSAETRPSYVVAGVPVLQSSLHGAVVPASNLQTLRYLYAFAKEDGDYVLYALDTERLAPAEVWRSPQPADGFTFYPLASTYIERGDDLLLASDGRLFSCDGTSMRVLETLQLPDGVLTQGTDYFVDHIAVIIQCKNGLLNIGADGALFIPTSENERFFAYMAGWIVTQEVGPEQTVVRCRRHDGEPGAVTDTYTVKNQYVAMNAGVYIAPELFYHNDKYAWGTAGFYELVDGRLRQWTDRPAIDYGFDASDGSAVIISHAPDKRVQFPARTGVYNPAGDEVLRIWPDGRSKMLLSNDPPHGMALTKVCYATNGSVRVNQYGWVLEYALQDGKIRVLPPSDTPDPGFYRDYIAAEQQRLDGLGAGAGTR